MKGSPEKQSPIASSELMGEYSNSLKARILAEGDTINRLIFSPPQTILVHVYGAEKNKDNVWIPNTEGRYAIRAALEFINAARVNHPDYCPVILTSGGHPSEHEGITISKIYRDAIEEAIQQRSLSDVTVIDEQQFSEENHAGRLACDTRGELTFLAKFCQQREGANALSIGRIEHGARIHRLLTANNIAAENVSIEGILAYFHPQVVERFVRRFSEIIESNHIFSAAEKKKLLIMLVDRKGALIELLAVIAGPIKGRLFKLIGQEIL